MVTMLQKRLQPVLLLTALLAIALMLPAASASQHSRMLPLSREIACSTLQQRDSVLPQPDSIVVTRYLSGAKKSEIPMQGGSINGIMLGWYESGEKEAEMPYRDNMAEGLHVHYYQNGMLKSKTLFIHGRKEGVEVLFHEDGRKWKEIPYVHGVAQEAVREWR